jgi:6-phosphogluconolactonase
MNKMAFKVALLGLAAMQAAAAPMLVYFGTYTGPKSKGIYVSRFDPATGKLEAPRVAAEIAGPSWVTIHPNGKFLYAVTESGNGAVSSFSIAPGTGELKLLNTVTSGGNGPCHLAITSKGTHIAVANYGSGSTAVFALGADGKIGVRTGFYQNRGTSVDKGRQEGPHAHAVVFSADDRFLTVPDLGTDEFLSFKVTGGMIERNGGAKVKGGLGPRHFALHPGHKFAYGLNEMGSAVTAFAYDAATGAMKELETVSTLPADFHGSSNSAEIQLDPKGSFVYASNRGHDSITVFAIDQKTGKLTFVQRESTQGKTPRGFNLDPTGKWLIAGNQDSDSVVLFKVDGTSGKLTPSGTKLTVGAPVCVQFLAQK